MVSSFLGFSVSQVLSFNDARFANEIAEDLAECIVSVADDYCYFLASSSTTGKNNLPRAAALMDLQQVSEVIEIIDDKTFKKPIRRMQSWQSNIHPSILITPEN